MNCNIKYSKDRQRLQKLMQENEKYSKMDKRAALVINAATNLRIKVENEIKGNGREEVDMCQAVAEMIEDAKDEVRNEMCQAVAEMMDDARAEGRAEGREEMCQAVAEMMDDARAEARIEEQTAVAKKLIKKGVFALNEIAELSGLSEEAVKKLM